MKIEELKQGQAVWVKGFVDLSVFGGCGGFINFYNQDGNHCGHISRNNVREMKEEDVQIDKPKPEVPKFVIDWIEICDMRFVNLNYIFGENCPEKVKEWASVYGNHKKMLQALLYGYTVEKEKLYTVEIPNPNKEGFEKLVLGKCYNNKIAICLTPNENWEKLGAYKLTEQEIRKDFDWAFRWAKEVTE